MTEEYPKNLVGCKVQIGSLVGTITEMDGNKITGFELDYVNMGYAPQDFFILSDVESIQYSTFIDAVQKFYAKEYGSEEEPD